MISPIACISRHDPSKLDLTKTELFCFEELTDWAIQHNTSTLQDYKVASNILLQQN